MDGKGRAGCTRCGRAIEGPGRIARDGWSGGGVIAGGPRKPTLSNEAAIVEAIKAEAGPSAPIFMPEFVRVVATVVEMEEEGLFRHASRMSDDRRAGFTLLCRREGSGNNKN